MVTSRLLLRTTLDLRQSSHKNYIHSALTGVNWLKGKNAYSGHSEALKEHAYAAVPNLQDELSGQDRSFIASLSRILNAMNKVENARDQIVSPGLGAQSLL